MSLEEMPRTGIGARSETRLRVRYAETDAMGIAHHAEYLAWVEVGRTDWIRSVGKPDARGPRSYRRLESAGYMLPVIEVSLRYHASARYDDEVLVETILSDATRVRLTFDYQILRAPELQDGERQVLVRAQSVHAVTDRNGRPKRLPVGVLEWVLGGDDGTSPEDASAPGHVR